MEPGVAPGSLLASPVLSLEGFPGLDTDHVQLEETEQTPELLQRVLQRSASQQEAVVGREAGQHLVQLRLVVLQPEENEKINNKTMLDQTQLLAHL